MNNLINNSLNRENKSIERIYDSLLANSWQQQVMKNKSVWVGYNIWILTEAYGYVVQFEPYQGVQKGKQVASSTNWGLGEKVVLWLINICKYISHLFVSLPTFKLTTFEQHLCSTKIGLANALSLGTSSCKKRNVATLNSSHQTKKQRNFDSGWLERQQSDLHSFF